MCYLDWQKIGLIPFSKDYFPWASSHLMVPTPLALNSHTIRLYVSCLDSHGLSRPGFLDIDVGDPFTIINASEQPLLGLGKPGTFDDNGVLVCSVVRHPDGRFFMYYVGFELGTKIRYRLLTGLAISDDGGISFKRFSDTPILERSDQELYFRCGPWCIFDNDRFKMWYVAGSDWQTINGKEMPVYEVKYIESSDGINWPNEGKTLVRITDHDEHGFGRPVLYCPPDHKFKYLHYSVRSISRMAYHLGVARSTNSQDWERIDDSLSLTISEHSFDSDAIMYSAPIHLNGTDLLFYNGNEFGREGIGVARLN
jgi:hypothetical protein